VVDRRAFFQQLLGNSRRLIASVHPLGFVHISLNVFVADLPEGLDYRLHLWPDRTRRIDELGGLHDHAWTLKSCVLLGGLADVTYHAHPSQDGEFNVRQVIYGQKNMFSDGGRAELVEVKRRTITAGQVYTVPARVIHQTEAVRTPAITLLVTEKDDHDKGPLVYSTAIAASGTAVRETLAAPEFDELLLRFEALL